MAHVGAGTSGVGIELVVENCECFMVFSNGSVKEVPDVTGNGSEGRVTGHSSGASSEGGVAGNGSEGGVAGNGSGGGVAGMGRGDVVFLAFSEYWP